MDAEGRLRGRQSVEQSADVLTGASPRARIHGPITMPDHGSIAWAIGLYNFSRTEHEPRDPRSDETDLRRHLRHRTPVTLCMLIMEMKS